MKTRSLILAITIAAVSSSFGRVVCAQAPRNSNSNIRLPGSRPPLSPYLNLLNNNDNFRGLGGQAAFNYYLRTRPQQRSIQFRNQFSNSLQNLERRVDRSELLQSRQSHVGATGHRTTFLNLGSYYPARR